MLHLLFWMVFSDEVVSASPKTMRTLLDSLDDGAILLDANDRVVVANASAMGVIGSEKAIGMPFRDVVRGDRLEALRDAIANEDDVTVTIGDEGQGREYLIEASPVRSSHDSDMGMILLLIDRAEGIELRHNLESANERLDMMSMILRHDLANQLMALDHYAGRLTDDMDDREFTEIPGRISRIVRNMGGQFDFSRTY